MAERTQKNLRVSQDWLDLITEAANLEDRTESSFIRHYTKKAAQDILSEHEQTEEDANDE